MKAIYIKNIASRLGLQTWQVENCIQMFQEGDTIPFISRYRKEKTGGLDDVEVASVKHYAESFEFPPADSLLLSLLKTLL